MVDAIKPVEFRTRNEHWYIWPDRVKICTLRPSECGRHLVPGPKKLEISREAMVARPDILRKLLGVLLSWQT